ncbi:MAG: DUF1049 domain-containing protein [Chromatiales bacterium]|nr:DUF1049 domain-containing protein [Chromatiales bacterium]
MRNLLWSLLVILILVLAGVFAALNTGRLSLDLAFVELELQKSVALLLALAAGWLFGLLCAGLVLLRLLSERRRLRKSVRLAEEEVRALRSLPANDAD